ncbi:class I SAM-dependent methyltransferase [Calothrix sp. NIES-3974]|uniref:class I SAM-dependent methyltransferase n=1 Tax=Calothrix sp. NIES-3974 TaxID=2005462 RepID=UPI000B601B55|nr:class I SAM-dependent methyltransferase [Calothrix sp. NIES-3974]BAZ04747.1 hypothetical protein NIES3974_13900 [Calothrix sp. NIES-3974]
MSNDTQFTLANLIKQQIRQNPRQRITFAEFMEMALYHPELGYYSSRAGNLGKEGDFFTSVHLGADFGEMIANQLLEMWEILQRPANFTLVEIGAGQGLLALDILKYLQAKHEDCFAATKYTIIEQSPKLQREQQQRLQGWSVTWCDLGEIPENSLVGCIFSNELVDALPVHQFAIASGEVQEIFVSVRENPGVKGGFEFVEVMDDPSTPELVNYLQSFGFDISNFPDGYRSEINLAARDWLGNVSRCLQQGYVITIDYGYPGHRYYNPRRTTGTLQCYFRHQRHNNPYINVGYQDITSHVNFTALEKWGEQYQLQTLGFTQQALFLMALGLGDRLVQLPYTNLPTMEVLQRRDYLQQLIDPMGLGGFGVLIQGKNVPNQLPTGLKQPSNP